MRCWRLVPERAVGLVALLLIASALVAGALLAAQRAGLFAVHPADFAVAALVGFGTLAVSLGLSWLVTRRLARRLEEIRLGTELMATVNPHHRLPVGAGDPVSALAGEINRMADRLLEARGGLEREVAGATRELVVERGKLAAVLDALGEGVVVATPEGQVTLANHGAHELLGAPRGGLLGRSLFDFADREKIGHYLERLRAAGGPAERFTLHPAAGGVLEAVMTPFFDDERRMIGFVLVFHDVTRPARSDAERQRTLDETLRALRNPLASIRSLSESLLGEPAVAATPAARLLGAIHTEAVRLSGLVQAMGESGRLGLAHPPWHFETIAFSDLAAMALRRLGSGSDGAGEVELEEEAGLPLVRAEGSAFSEALAHLVRVVLARRKPGTKAWLRSRRRGRTFQIDAGAEGGAPLADLEAVLDAALPVGAARRLTVREVVQQHAGEVWAHDSGDRIGFRITLPGAEAGERAPEPAEAGWAARGASFVGAGLFSGVAPTEGKPERPALYDFSLFQEMERHLLPVDRERLLHELSCVVFDLETTGLRPEDGDRMVSVAGVRVRAGAVRRGETFDALVNPRRPIPEASTRFHGITDAMVAEAPPVGVVLPAFLRFVEGAILVGHQVWFDVRVLAFEAGRLGLPPITLAHPVLDTAALSEVVHGALVDHTLDGLARRLGVAARGRHSALGDALVTAEVFVRLVELLKRRGIRTLGEALDAAKAVRGVRADDALPGAGP